MGQAKKCPFCGDRLITRERKDIFYHTKNGCLLQGSILMQDQLELWNTRKPMERIVERVHGYFVSEINALPTDEIPHDILRHNKQICKIVKEEFLE